MPGTPRIAYLGDGTLPGPASYLAGIMTHFGLEYVHVPSGERPPASVFDPNVGLYVLSDYPAANFDPACMRELCEHVIEGAGLLMLGGWKSYHGQGGDYDQTPLAELLPVRMSAEDDRRNWPQLILVRARADHPIAAGLPFDRPPSIGGYNEFEAAPDATVALRGERYRVSVAGAEVELYLGEEGERHVITHTTIVHIPKGMIHCPLNFKKIDRPIMFLNVPLTAHYGQIKTS